MDPKKIWPKTLGEIKSEIGLVNYNFWFTKTELLDIRDQLVSLSVPSAFFESSIRAKFLAVILKSLKKVTGQEMTIDFKIDSSKLTKKPSSEDKEFFDFIPQVSPNSYTLNPKYTLENFVVGLSNNVAFAAAQAVVQNPGVSYNPLFIYGGTGVGKTHLMLGIGNAILKNNPNYKIIYCSSEKFMNDYVEAIKTQKMGNLRNRYRSANILLIDDVQFFSGREGTQEEFFHTFNELQGRNSQIVLTSDKAPGEIAKLEDRLKSRFVGGLMIDMQPPDFDTRVAILKAKCEERGETLPEDSLRLLAQSLESNIRELEGKLIQILQISKAQTLELTPENISKYLSRPKKLVSLDPRKVLSLICGYFNLNLKDLSGPKRQKELVLPRHIAMYLLTEELRLTVEKVGSLLGGRDHTTVMHGRDRIRKLVNTDREIQKMVIEVKQTFPQ